MLLNAKEIKVKHLVQLQLLFISVGVKKVLTKTIVKSVQEKKTVEELPVKQHIVGDKKIHNVLLPLFL